MIDIVREIEAVQREVGSGRLAAGEGQRRPPAARPTTPPIDDVWDALTNPERIGRWFLPISGDFRLGGRYQFEGNAGGEILACERPNRLKVTWVYGEVTEPADVSEVEVRLSPVDERTRPASSSSTSAIVPDEMWDEFGPGAVGVGWDGGSSAWRSTSAAARRRRPEAWQLSDEGRDFVDAEQRGLGRGEPGRRRRSRGRRARRRGHDRVLHRRAEPGGIRAGDPVPGHL